MKTTWLGDILMWFAATFNSSVHAQKALIGSIGAPLMSIAVGGMAAHVAAQYMEMTTNQSIVFAIALESFGYYSTLNLVDNFIEWTRSRNSKAGWAVVVFAVVALAYLGVMIGLMVNIRAENSTVTSAYKTVVFLMSLLPFLMGISNGFGIKKLEYQAEQEAKKALEEQLRQEGLAAEEKRRQDAAEQERALAAMKIEASVKKAAMKQGINVFAETPAQPQLPAPAEPQVKERHAGDYKEYVFELLEQHGEIPLTEITRLVNKGKRLSFVHKDVKGTWFKFVKEWKRSKGVA